jgi:hypothetical protein
MSQIDGTAPDSTSTSSGHACGSSDLGTPARTAALQQSYAAFLQDLPFLLGRHAGEWAAYVGNRRLAIGPSKRTLFRECLAAGHRSDEILICGIEQPRENVIDRLLDV